MLLPLRTPNDQNHRNTRWFWLRRRHCDLIYYRIRGKGNRYTATQRYRLVEPVGEFFVRFLLLPRIRRQSRPCSDPRILRQQRDLLSRVVVLLHRLLRRSV